MPRYGKGCRPSAPHKLAARAPVEQHPDVGPRLAAHRDGRVGLAPASDLASFEPPRMDQDGTDCCHSHSTAGATATAFAAAGQPLGYVPSQAEIARTTYALARAAGTPPGSPLPPLVDHGAELGDDVAALARFGIVPMAANVDDRNSDATPASVIAEPALSDLEIGAEKIVAGGYAIDPAAPDVSDQIAACIASGLPVVVGYFCDTACENWTAGSPPLGAPNMSDQSGGGHAVYISGYVTQPDGSRAFWITNSWGSSYGDGGRFLASEAWLRACWELWAWSVAKKGAA